MESIDISFKYDNHSDQSLIKLWKLTRNDFISSKFSSAERLNNRSWRLLSKNLLIKGIRRVGEKDALSSGTSESTSSGPVISHSISDLSRDSLSDLAPKSSQFLSDRPSLFSHSSNLSLHSNRKSTNNSSLESYDPKSGNIPDSEEDEDDDDFDDDISDISDISEEGEEDYDDEPESKQTLSAANDLTSSNTSGQNSHAQPSAFVLRPRAASTNPATTNGVPPPLIRSRTSFVRGFSPSRVSISPASPYINQKQNHSASRSSLTMVDPNPKPPPNKNIFYIANSPSPPNPANQLKMSKIEDKNSPLVSPTNQASRSTKQPSTRQAQVSQSNFPSTSRGATQAPTTRHSLSAQSGQPNTNPRPGHIQRHNSLFSNFQFKANQEPTQAPVVEPTNTVKDKVEENDDEGYSSTDISEDDEEDEGFSEDEEKPLETSLQKIPPQPSQSTRSSINQREVMVQARTRGSSSATQGATDNDSEWLSVSSEDDDLQSEEPKFHPLQFAKIPTMSKVVSNSSVATDIVPIESNESQKRLKSKRYSSPAIGGKPRSLLSGLFLNELAHQNQSSGQTSSSKPVLKRSSTTGVITFDENRNLVSADAKLKRPYIMFTKKYNSSTDVSKHHLQKDTSKNDPIEEKQDSDVNQDVLDKEESILGKQKSIVGISDFNVTASSSNSILNESKEGSFTEINASKSSQPESSNSHAVLSTSLNRLSGSMTNSSIRNLLSKSSLNITRLYNNSKTIFGKGEEGRIEVAKPAKPVSPEPPKSEILLSKPSPKLTSTPVSTTPKKANEIKSEKAEKYRAKPEFFDTDDDSVPEDKAQLFKLSPKSTRRTMLSSELSTSLKESIIIDYKLGKVPLPNKVVDNAKLMGGLPEDTGEEMDDYYSKGW